MVKVRRDLRPPIIVVLIGLIVTAAKTLAMAHGEDDAWRQDLAPGVWHYRSIPCVNTTVRNVEPYFRVYGTSEDYKSGVIVLFNTDLGVDPLFPKDYAKVVNRGPDPVMVAEHRGDRVQVCFLGVPAPRQMPGTILGCNPDKDPRGRGYRVYDYRQQKSYAGWNSNHGCGGA